MGNFQSCKQSYNDLEHHVATLKQQNGQLLHKVNQLEQMGTTKLGQDFQSLFNNIDDVKIEEFVDKLLEQDSINFTLIPDEIEKLLYQNMIKLVLSIIRNQTTNN